MQQDALAGFLGDKDALLREGRRLAAMKDPEGVPLSLTSAVPLLLAAGQSEEAKALVKEGTAKLKPPSKPADDMEDIKSALVVAKARSGAVFDAIHGLDEMKRGYARDSAIRGIFAEIAKAGGEAEVTKRAGTLLSQNDRRIAFLAAARTLADYEERQSLLLPLY